MFERDGKPMPGIGETLLSAYESGLKRPGPEYLHYLCSVYRVEPAALGFEGPCICGHGHRMPGVVRGGQQDAEPGPPIDPRELWIKPLSDPSTTDGGEEDENVLRRTLLQIMAGGAGAAVPLTAPVLGAADGIRRRMDDTLVSSTVSPAMLDHWEEAATSFGKQYMNTPPMRQLCDVLLEFSQVRQALDRHQPIDLQERLCILAARLSGLAGIIMIDFGDQRMSRSFFRTARLAADETGDRALRAWVTAREALVPLFLGDPRDALTLAKKSRDLAGQTPCAAKAMAPVVEARALSMLANAGGKKDVVDQAKRALSRARAAFAQMTPAQQEDTVFGYTERQLYFHQGDTLARLGQTIEADLILEQALEKYEGDLLDQTLIRFDRAHCRLLEGDGDEALRLGMEAVRQVGEGFRTDIILRRANELVRAIHARCGDIAGLQTFRDVLASSPPTTPAAEPV
ncbi:hypothetical protein Sme01_66660 [Sphaerisporangium melleum]|uniref:HTH cro/C1-type domain-containing protein n=1 Tax=Sphaerisporangium melleum TaxID=321316 RepID=A0A917VRB3_9ACTN|nr:hypothetical protein GCM10007964_55890 [Sphaerisporangium melleum]GII74190.1 hypothetical protein Sme01_66660 [Sphaerisporangium melleum]